VSSEQYEQYRVSVWNTIVAYDYMYAYIINLWVHHSIPRPYKSSVCDSSLTSRTKWAPQSGDSHDGLLPPSKAARRWLAVWVGFVVTHGDLQFLFIRGSRRML